MGLYNCTSFVARAWAAGCPAARLAFIILRLCRRFSTVSCRLTPTLLLTLSNRLHIGVFVYEQVVLRDLLDENMGDCVRINEAPVFLFQQKAGERSFGSDKHPTKIIFLEHLFPTGQHGDDV